jgi:hypothetical protein
VHVLACLVPGSVREICGVRLFFSLFFFWKKFSLFLLKKQFNNHMYMLMKLLCTSQRGNMWPCSLELISQPFSSVFLSQQISE